VSSLSGVVVIASKDTASCLQLMSSARFVLFLGFCCSNCHHKTRFKTITQSKLIYIVPYVTSKLDTSIHRNTVLLVFYM